MIPNSNTTHQLEQKKTLETYQRKRRGNRKEQHRRRRLRRRQQNMDNNNNNNATNNTGKNTTETLNGTDHLNMTTFQNISQNNNKRKRQTTNTDNLPINRSFSQLSISEENIKKTKMTPRNTDHLKNDVSSNHSINHSNSQNEVISNSNDHVPLLIHNLQKYKSHYSKVSNYTFKQMLLSHIIQDGDKLIQCLDTHEKLQCIRQITEQTHHLNYLGLQRELWQDYYNIGLKDGDVWAVVPRLSKSFAKQHHTCVSYGFPKHIIEKRQKTIEHQIQSTTNELNQQLAQVRTLSQQWQPSIDLNTLYTAIDECVKNGQQRLRQQFYYRRKMLVFDSNDHQLIKKFYDLQPNEEQICLALMIWKTTANELESREYEQIVRKRIFLRRLPSTMDTLINQSTSPFQSLLANSALHKDLCASLASSCSKTVTQFKFDLMIHHLDAIENIIRGHRQILNDLEAKLFQSNTIHSSSIKQVILDRQQTMRDRHEIYLKHKLNTFFDQAPMTRSNE